MAKKSNQNAPSAKQKLGFPKMIVSKKNKVLLGAIILFLGVVLLLAFTSYFFSWKADQSILNDFGNKEIEAKNWMKKLGAQISHFFIYQGFGVASYYIAALLSVTGFYLFLNISLRKLTSFWFWGLAAMLWLAVFFQFVAPSYPILGGVVGFEINAYLQVYIGKIGIGVLLLFLLIFYFIVRLDFTPDVVVDKIKNARAKAAAAKEEAAKNNPVVKPSVKDTTEAKPKKEIPAVPETHPPQKNLKNSVISPDIQESTSESPKVAIEKIIIQSQNEDDVDMEVETAADEDELETISKKLVEDFGEFDPTLELPNFQFPGIDLLKDYNKGRSITIDQSELESNKNKIVETLKNYKIGIAEIKATVGPTVTLYEIIPEAGIRISKIKNLEDDIALSLSALGIRIIAPIPGKGTIGIEVPNQNPSVVPMRTVIASSKFQETKMELPIAFGKTISNETFVVDLAKMPHLLMAGATGQGKSVGLNVILTSLLYQKHPAEVKFILVDPKKVELTLFNKIERHYLAKMPDVEEAIITDNSKVINTLNSLCLEMDSRYDMLKEAMVRNISEYNEKFKARKLNPEHGHKFLPYIVLVIDEFADLIMTAGKEVETPIARLAQLARAIGIHLIIATQRPSVNVITGMIKANFPARLAFRVTSKIDSRTILDAGGADQLIGRGDMLFTQGNDLVRLQCAFVDTPEVERITEFIGSQKAYPDAHLLPEYAGEESGTSLDDNIDERDKRFREAAEIIVTSQQGSASLLQRKMKLGYNRAGRLIDQLEAAGIVGPFEGSKARQVLITDLTTLEQMLDN